jgi:hypothetical protein
MSGDVVLITDWTPMVDAVTAAGLDPQVFPRIGLAASAGALTSARLLLLDYPALRAAAPLAPLDTTAQVGVVVTADAPDDMWHLLGLFGDGARLFVLPAAGPWLAQHYGS